MPNTSSAHGKSKKAAPAKDSKSVSEMVKGLSPKEAARVLRFGPIAVPEYDEDGTLTQKYTAFMYVWQVATADKMMVLDPEEREKMLYQCLLAALKQGDGTVFRHVANAVEAVAIGLKTKGAYPYHLAVLEAQQPPIEFRKHPLFRVWGDDMKPTNAAILKKLGKDPKSADDKRSLRRAKVALGLELNSGKPGKPRTSKKIK